MLIYIFNILNIDVNVSYYFVIYSMTVWYN